MVVCLVEILEASQNVQNLMWVNNLEKIVNVLRHYNVQLHSGYHGSPGLTCFKKVRVLIFAHQNRVRSIFLEFLQIVVTELVIYVFGVFIGIIRGTLDKRIPEGLF